MSSQDPVPARQSLCFMRANRLRGDQTVPEDEWMWHLVQHMRGVRHRSLCKPPEQMTPRIDPVGHSVRQIALNDDYKVLDEIEASLYGKLLLHALHGEVEHVNAWFNDVKSLRDPYLDPLQPVATIGAFKGHMPVLKFALEKGAQMNRDLAFAIQKGAKMSTEMASFYEKDQANLDEIIEAPYRPDPNYKPNVPEEWAAAIDRDIIR